MVRKIVKYRIDEKKYSDTREIFDSLFGKALRILFRKENLEEEAEKYEKKSGKKRKLVKKDKAPKGDKPEVEVESSGAESLEKLIFLVKSLRLFAWLLRQEGGGSLPSIGTGLIMIIVGSASLSLQAIAKVSAILNGMLVSIIMRTFSPFLTLVHSSKIFLAPLIISICFIIALLYIGIFFTPYSSIALLPLHGTGDTQK